MATADVTGALPDAALALAAHTAMHAEVSGQCPAIEELSWRYPPKLSAVA